MLRCFIILFSSIGITDCLSQSLVVKGRVTEFATHEVLPGASIRSAADHQLGSTTNNNGEFEITLIAGDTLLVSFIGFEELRIPVEMITAFPVTLELKAISRTIEAVEIKAERIIAEEFTIRKIKKLDIYTNPSAKADPILAVNATPSATTTDESANISLRGGSPAETGIFLNNVPINDAVRYSQLNGIGTFSIFNTAIVNSVLVYPGNPPLEYGNSTSGLIALQTDEVIPEKAVNTVSLTLASIGMYSSRKLGQQSSLTFFSNYQPSAFIRTLNSKSLKDLKAFSSADLGIHYFKKLKSNASVKLFNYSVLESYQFHLAQPTYDGTFKQDKIRNFTVGNFRKRIGNTELSFNQGLSFSKAGYKYGTTNIDLKLQDLFSSFNVHRSGILSEWKTGISYDHKSSDFDGSFPVFAFASGMQHPVASASARDHVTNPEWFGYYKYFLGAKWIAGGGIRKNIVIDQLKNYFSIQGNLNYKPAASWNVNLSAGQYHKYQLPQGENSIPFLIRSKQYSADINHTASSWENSLSVFYKETTITETETAVKGIELFTRYRISPAMRFQLSFTGLDAKETTGRITAPSPYNIHYFVRGNVEYKIQGTWTITTVFLFRQGSYYYPVTEAPYNEALAVYEPAYTATPERLPSYNTVDVSISKIFLLTQKSTAITFLSAGNILNFKNVRTYNYNFDYTQRNAYLFSLRTFYFGLIVNF